MRILITGAAGQVGTDLIPLLLERGHAPAAFDLAKPPPSHPRDVPWITADVTVEEEVFDAVNAAKPDSIWHLAAILSATGERIPFRAWRVNMEGTKNVLEAARLLGVKQVLFTSTIAAFGPGLDNPVGNDVSMRPTTMYGLTKVAGELLGEYYRAKWGLDFRGVRFPGLISAVEPGGGTSDYVNHMYFAAAKGGSYDAFCRPDTTIPLMYVPDALRALCELSEAPDAVLTRRIYNIAAMSPRADEIAAAVRRRSPSTRIGFVPDPMKQAILDSWPKALDDTLARKDWGWTHRYDLDAMSDELMSIFRRGTGSPATPPSASIPPAPPAEKAPPKTTSSGSKPAAKPKPATVRKRC